MLPVLVVAENSLSVCHFDGCDEMFVDADFGVREVRKQVQQGDLRLGNRAVLVMCLGRADVIKGRNWMDMLEEFIVVCATFAPHTQVVWMGPLPAPNDNTDLIQRLARLRAETEIRLRDQAMFIFSTIGDRFGDERGINRRFFCEDVLTVRGCQVMRREVNDLLHLLSVQ